MAFPTGPAVGAYGSFFGRGAGAGQTVAVRLLAILVAISASGCISVSLQRKPTADDSIEVSPPGEDGTRYVAVRSGRRTRADALERKWTRVATQACEGDYVLMSDGSSEQRRAGVLTSRTHEGFVRCLMPAQAEAAEQVDAQASRRGS